MDARQLLDKLIDWIRYRVEYHERKCRTYEGLEHYHDSLLHNGGCLTEAQSVLRQLEGEKRRLES